MKKYLYGFKLYFLNCFHYRFNTIISLIFENINIIITIMFWILIYQNNNDFVINGFSLKDMITYFIAGSIFRTFIFNNSGFTYSKMIKDGTLSTALIKPFSISISIYFNNLSNSITSIFPQLVLLIVLMPLIAKYLVWNLNITNVIFLFIFLLISTISSHIMWSILGFIAFWFEEVNAVMWSFAVLLNLVTGMFIPLDFFPKWSIAIIELLPFSSWGYIPSKIYLGLFSPEKMLFLLTINIGWIVILFLINRCVWLFGLRKYSSIGG